MRGKWIPVLLAAVLLILAFQPAVSNRNPFTRVDGPIERALRAMPQVHSFM